MIQCVEEGETTYSDTIILTEYLVNKVNLFTQAEYARKIGISRAGIKKRIESGKEATLKINGKDFIIG